MGRALVLGLVLLFAGPASAQEGRHQIAGAEIVQSGTGAFDRAQLLTFFEGERAQIHGCHTQAMRRRPIRGRVTLEMTLALGGLASPVTVAENTTGSGSLARCLARIVRGQLFLPGPSVGSVTFRVPIDLDVGPPAPPPPAPPEPFSRATIDRPVVDATQGDIDPDSVRRRLRSRTVALRTCFERGVAAAPDLRGGEISLQLAIDEGGRVSEVHATTTTLADSGVSACVEQLARTLRFNPGSDDGRAQVTTRIVFERLRDGPPPPPPAPASDGL